MSTNGALLLTEVRAAAAAALAPGPGDELVVLPDMVDSLEPPALLLEWNDPWLSVRSVGRDTIGGSQLWEALLNVLCIAGRLEPGPGIITLEQLLTYTIERLAGDAHPWPLSASQAPRGFRFGDIWMLGARLSFRVPVQLGGA